MKIPLGLSVVHIIIRKNPKLSSSNVHSHTAQFEEKNKQLNLFDLMWQHGANSQKKKTHKSLYSFDVKLGKISFSILYSIKQELFRCSELDQIQNHIVIQKKTKQNNKKNKENKQIIICSIHLFDCRFYRKTKVLSKSLCAHVTLAHTFLAFFIINKQRRMHSSCID